MTVMWRAARNEAATIVRDPGAWLILVAGVLAYGLLYPVPYWARVVREVPIIVVDQDRSPTSRQLVRMLDAHAALQVSAVTGDTLTAAREIEAGRVHGALVVPDGFARRIARAEATEVVGVADATYFLIYKTVLSGMAETVGTLSAGVEMRRLEARGTPDWLAALLRAPIRVEARPLFNPAESYTAYVVPAIYVVILHQTLLIGIGLVQGTRREQAGPADARVARRSPLEALSVLAGRTLVYLLIYVVHVAIYFGVLLPWLGLPPAVDGLTLARFLLPFLLATIWLGVALGGIFRTRESSMATIFLVSSLVVFSVGFAWPREAMAPWVAPVTAWLPAMSAVTGVLRLAQMGASAAEVRPEWVWLWQLSAVYFVLAWVTELVSDRGGRRAAAAS